MSAISAGRVSPCVVDGVQDLLGRQADVDGVQHGAHHRHAKEALQVAVAVPVHHRHRVARLDAEAGEPGRQPADALEQRSVVEALHVAVDDLLLRGMRQGRV